MISNCLIVKTKLIFIFVAKATGIKIAEVLAVNELLSVCQRVFKQLLL